jgi:hypothetical protein
VAGPSIVVRVLGDLKGLGQSFSDAGAKAEGAAARGQAAFHSFLSGINATGVLGPLGPMLDTVDQGLQRITEHGAKLGPVMVGAGGAITAVGAALTAFGSHEQQSQQQLKQAIDNTGKSYDDYATRIEEAIRHGESFGKTSAQTQDALRVLTQATHDPAKALELLGTAFDLSAAKHEDLSAAATAMGRAFNGNTRILKEFGVVAAPAAAKAAAGLATATKAAESADSAYATAQQHLADVQAILHGRTQLTVTEQIRLRDAQQAVTVAGDKAAAAHQKLATVQDAAAKATSGAGENMKNLANVLHGQASAAADTFGGKLAAVRAKIEDAVSAFGQKYGPAIQGIGVAILALGAIWTAVGPIIAGFEWATLGPILLIVAAVAAVIAIGYVLYRNWDTIWGAIQSVIQTVWDWISNHWPLLLAILLGPIGIAVDLIVAYWDQIQAGISAVIDWIAGHWQLLVAILLGPITLAVYLIAQSWDTIKNGASAAVDWIAARFNELVAFFRGLPGEIASALAGLGDILLAPFKWAYDQIRSVVRDIKSAINTIKDLPGSIVSGIGGLVGLQHGGIVTRPTLALIGEHGPEAVVPLGLPSALPFTGTAGYGAPIYVTINAGGLGADAPEIQRAVVEALRGYVNRNGRLVGVT